ncbi:hypothetical protein M422DRAFT_150700 [Sphaerobolus stellatus SS14]|nr:hypothetical protein M422DRAFT_150700 [Sphaerobolus stellatus SS14]
MELEAEADDVRSIGGGKGGGGRDGSSGGSERGSSSDEDSSGSSSSSDEGSSSGRGSSSSSSSSSKSITTIPSGQAFAGRMVGGGTRDQIYGTSQYGSGYPGQSVPSVLERGFPFGFWPLSFGSLSGFVIAREISDFREYGSPTNSSRPGGALSTAAFQPSDSSNTYRLLSDNATVSALIPSTIASCAPSSENITAIPFTGSSNSSASSTSGSSLPQPEQTIQHYRSSSIALSLDGYNNTAVFSNDINAGNTPLPSIKNQTFLECLNSTIGNDALFFFFFFL